MKSLLQIIVTSLVSLFAVSANAQAVEKVVLKNGSVLEGYLAEQRPGISFSVNSTSAVIFANEDSLLTVQQEQVELSTLSAVWQKWAKANGVVDEKNGGSKILMSTISFRNSTISNVFVQERGITIKFLDLNGGKYIFPWNQLSMTSKTLRPDNQFSGIIDELIMTNGNHYEGQVTDQTPGKGIKIIMQGGQVQSFNYTDIAQIISKPLNPKMTIWEQSQLLDEVVTKSTGESIQGIITSRQIGKNYSFVQKNGQVRIVSATDVAIFRKKKNPEYKSAMDRQMAEGEILINGNAKNAYFFQLETTENVVILNQEMASMQMFRGDTLVVEANLGNPSAAIRIAKAQVRDIEVVNEKGKKEKHPGIVVTLFDLLNSKNAGTREITPLGHIKYSIPILESGDYLMQIEGKDGYIIINVPKVKHGK